MNKDIGRFMFHFWQEYSELNLMNDVYKWRNFTFIQFDTELAHYKCSFEIHLALLGLHFTLCYFWGEFSDERD